MSVGERLVQIGLLGEAVDNAPVLVFVADENGRYLAVSSHACELLGYTREELLALTLPDVARYGAAPEEFGVVVAERLREGTSTLTRKDGSEFEFRYRASEVQVAGMTLYVAVGFDLASPPKP